MPSDAAQLATIKSQILANLVAITASPKPTYNLDGQMVDWNTYRKSLLDSLAELDDLINANAPFEIHSQGHSP